jgi:hypothetical protein
MDHTYYLCVQKGAQDGFICRPFSSFLEADRYFELNYNVRDTQASTLLRVNRLMPLVFHNYILTNQLSNQFMKVKILPDNS